MIASPPPVLRMPIGGTCDANGNLTLKSIVPSRSWYGVFTAILKVSSGAPQWEIDLLGMPVGVAGGGSAVMGAVYSNPEDSFTLIVTGAAPNAVVSGGLYGFLAAEPEQLPQLGAISSGGGGGTTGALPGGQATVRGNLVALGDAVAIPCGGASFVSFTFNGGIVGGTQIALEGTSDDTNWGYVEYLPIVNSGEGWTADAITVWSVAQPFVVATSGYSQVRARFLSFGGGQPVVTVVARATPGSQVPLPFGRQTMARSQPVTIASDQSAVPVTTSPPTAQLATYWLAVGNSAKAIGAGAVEQLLVIYHPATVAELVKVRKIIVTIESNTVASILTIRVRRLNGATAPSGGTAVSGIAAAGDAAMNASDVIQTYPTTKGTTDVGAAATQSFSVGVSAAPTDVTKLQPITVYSNDDATNRKPLTIRASTAEGWEVEINSSAASTVVASVAAEVTVG